MKIGAQTNKNMLSLKSKSGREAGREGSRIEGGKSCPPTFEMLPPPMGDCVWYPARIEELAFPVTVAGCYARTSFRRGESLQPIVTIEKCIY
jgi:hypothetical protein